LVIIDAGLIFSNDAQVCAGLSSRLQEYKSENAQLEELLTAEVKHYHHFLFKGI